MVKIRREKKKEKNIIPIFMVDAQANIRTHIFRCASLHEDINYQALYNKAINIVICFF